MTTYSCSRIARRCLTALALFATLSMTGTPAQAAECGRRDYIIKQLGKQFAEVRRATGMMRKSGLMEIYVSKKKGTWTVLVTSPRGMTCIVAAGEMWEDMPIVTAGPAA